MEMFLLMLMIIMSALVITYHKEIYIYLVLVLGSLITDVLNFLNKFKKK